MLKKIVVGLIVVVGLGLVGAYLLPRQVHVERTTSIAAQQATVFALVNNFKGMNRWSPWAEMDPNAQYTFAGPDAGVGAKMTWKGDPANVGEGTQEIVESKPYELVRTALDFGEQGTGVAVFTLTREGDATKVVWSFETDLGNNPIARYFGLTFDNMVGTDYEKGLAKLKTLAESMPKADIAGLSVEAVDVKPVTIAYVEATSTKDDKAVAQAMGNAYTEVGKFITQNKLKMAGAPISINTKWDDSGYAFEAGIPVETAPQAAASAKVKVKNTYTGKALKVTHKGAYREMEDTYEKLFAYAKASGLETNGNPWDEYVTDPQKTPEPDLVTHIYLPVK